MTQVLWSRPPLLSALHSLVNTQPRENGTAGEGWRYRAPFQTLPTSSYQTQTEISGAFLLGHLMVKSNSG